MQTSYRSTWARYQRAWEHVSSAERQASLEQSVSDDCIYTDPMGETHGRAELAAYIENFRITMPTGSFKNLKFLEHHDQSMAEWMLFQNGAELQPGSSWARFGVDGRITNVTGFFAVPESA